MKFLNEVFDHIFVMTVPTFVDRIENMKSRLNGVDYEFFYGAYGGDIDVQHYRNLGSKLTRGQMSCSLSHVLLYEKIVKDNLDNVLILEDDCAFNENIQNVSKCHEQLPENFDIFYLGYDCPSYVKFSENLYTATTHIGHTHSICISNKCARKMAEHNKNLLWTADGAFVSLLENNEVPAYLANPKMTYQDNNGSDAKCVQVDKDHGMGL
jgi:glycosyl transferase family 25